MAVLSWTLVKFRIGIICSLVFYHTRVLTKLVFWSIQLLQFRLQRSLLSLTSMKTINLVKKKAHKRLFIIKQTKKTCPKQEHVKGNTSYFTCRQWFQKKKKRLYYFFTKSSNLFIALHCMLVHIRNSFAKIHNSQQPIYQANSSAVCFIKTGFTCDTVLHMLLEIDLF